MLKALIVYTSLTGNTRACTKVVEDALKTAGVEVTVKESVFADPIEFQDVDLCLVGTYTYGIDGQLPDEIVDFYEELGEIDLTGKVFGTYGSGDTFYGEYYCKSVDDFTDQFKHTGAKEGAESVHVDLDPEEEDKKKLIAFANQLVETWKKNAQ